MRDSACFHVPPSRPAPPKSCPARRSTSARSRKSRRLELPGGVRTVDVLVGREGRSARVDGKAVRDPDELFGGLATVAFTPEDLAVVKEGPDARRRLLDRAVLNRHPSHLRDSRDYLRALRSRNHLLRQRADAELLASFDEPLVRLGARIRPKRAE